MENRNGLERIFRSVNPQAAVSQARLEAAQMKMAKGGSISQATGDAGEYLFETYFGEVDRNDPQGRADYHYIAVNLDEVGAAAKLQQRNAGGLDYAILALNSKTGQVEDLMWAQVKTEYDPDRLAAKIDAHEDHAKKGAKWLVEQGGLEALRTHLQKNSYSQKPVKFPETYEHYAKQGNSKDLAPVVDQTLHYPILSDHRDLPLMTKHRDRVIPLPFGADHTIGLARSMVSKQELQKVDHNNWSFTGLADTGVVQELTFKRFRAEIAQ